MNDVGTDTPVVCTSERSPRPSPTDRLLAVLEILLVALLGTFVAVLFCSLAGIPWEQAPSNIQVLFFYQMTEASITILILTLFLRSRGQSLRTIGWKKGNWSREVMAGIAAVPLLFAILALVTLAVAFVLPEWVTRVNPLLSMIDTPQAMALFLLMGIYAGGLKEELQRAFVLRRFSTHLGGAALGLVVWSSLFGVAHLEQGKDNALKAGVLGLLFGIFFLTRKNAIGPVTAHAVFNAAVVLLTWLYPQN